MEERSHREPDPEEPLDPIEQSEAAAGRPTPEQIAGSISVQLQEIHERSYGRSAQAVKSHLFDDTLIVLMEGLELLPNEQFLIDQGHADAVAHVRHQYQKAIEATFRAAVERATGRRVTGFASHVSLGDDPFIAEIFRLEPE